MILSDIDLRSYIVSRKLYIEPYYEDIVRENGLDLRLGNEVCEMVESEKTLDPYGEWDAGDYFKCYETVDSFVTKPWARYLMHTIEYIELPSDLVGFVELRSTFARLGFMIPPTMVDGGFKGQLTIEVQTPPFPVRLRVGTRFLHLILSRTSTPIEKPYRGAYQGQRGVRLPKKLEYP